MELPIYQQLEKEYAHFTGSRFAVACNSGTSALHLALVSLGVGRKDEVIVPDFTMAACGFAVAYTGATPVFVDCDTRLNIDTSLIEQRITPKTKAIMVAHIYGRLVDMKAILKIAKKHKLYVIEDACEAQGAVYKSKADITCYSFFKNKIINAEEGGICTTNSKYLADRMNYFKNMAFNTEHNYYHADIGFNYRMPDSQAKLALKSLKEYIKNNKKRRQVEKWYNELVPKELQMPKRDAVWVYDTKIPWREVKGARHFFKPLSMMPMWKQKVGKNAKYFSQFMYLPVNPQMTKKDIISTINQCKIEKN